MKYKPYLLAMLLLSGICKTAFATNDTLIAANAIWKYLDNGANLDTAWRQPGYTDGSWLSGAAELGYGDGDEATVVGYGSNASAKYITTYFRRAFTVANPAAYTALLLNVVRDDGLIVYINGQEVYRNNMPAGAVSYTTLAPSVIGGADETTWQSAVIGAEKLISGTNVIAVEVHQSGITSSDISFKLQLSGNSQAVVPVVTRGAYLQKLHSSGVTIRWHTDIASNSKVQFGNDISYGREVSDATVTNEHVVTINGLTPATRYYYSIGTSSLRLQGDTNNTFSTAAPTGSTTPLRIWAIGDFGNGAAGQDAVRNAYMNYPGAYETNVWLWLGDNAYSNGLEPEYQANVFNKYPVQFKRFGHYPSPGNHDYAQAGYQSTASLGTAFPYFDLFSVPQAGEAGGVASNSPKYYSFNYGNIHFISLDSYGALNADGSPMYNWLKTDLAANTQTWTVVYFHHPPYTMGSHNSDNEEELIDMRTSIVPLLESYNTDLVLAGHSHVNERSYFMNGHYGLSGTFDSTMRVGTDSTNFIKTGVGTVYAVCGTSGQAPGAVQAGYPMACMYFSNNSSNCSMVIDVAGSTLSAKYLTGTGVIVDSFTITKPLITSVTTETQKQWKAYYCADKRGICIDYNLAANSRISVSLWNEIGQRVNGIPAANLSGIQHQLIQLTEPASAVYVVQVSIDGQEQLSKVVVGQ